MNEDIYAMVCRLHFKSDSTVDEIVQIIGGTLLKYRHRDEDNKITKFNSMSRAVEVIIDNEIQAHKQAKKFVSKK
jgi:hypothetical protein